MQVHKFGGASLKTAKAVRNMFEILCDEIQNQLVVVVSAMGKTTNALEEILELQWNDQDIRFQLQNLKKYHLKICEKLFSDPEHPVFRVLSDQFIKLEKSLKNVSDARSFEENYDQIVSFGEQFSTLIISFFLNENQVLCSLVDARKLIRTSDDFTDAKINWEETEKLIKGLKFVESAGTILLTQGFIGGTNSGKTTTLGREGSDFTAAIFATCIGATSVTLWKDVPGIMNGDPKLIEDAVLLDCLPYEEAAEMTYYGAKVIHPKTIRPLANSSIPLFVKDFNHPDRPGTCIKEYKSWERVPVVIYKNDQWLISFKFTDFSFVNERSLMKIYDVLDRLDIKINMMQNSAISFSICIDFHPTKTPILIRELKVEFNLHYNSGLTLLTIKNYIEDSLAKYRPQVTMLLEQQTRAVYQAVFKRA